MVKGSFCFILVIVMLVSVASINGSIAKAESSVNSEIMELRDEKTKAYREENGQIGYKFYTARVHYKDDHGKFQEIDSSIVTCDDSGYKYKNRANDWNVYFGDIEKNKQIRIEKGKYAINCTFQNTDTIIPVEKLPANEKYNKDNISKYSVIYRNVQPFTNLTYTVGSDFVKENIIIEEFSGVLSYDFWISTENLKIYQDNGNLFLVDKNNDDRIFNIESPYIEDASGMISSDCYYTYQQMDDAILLTVHLPEEIMSSKDTKYPVTVDPIFTGISNTKDLFVACKCVNPSICSCTDVNCSCNKNYNTSASGSNRYYLRTGKDTPYGVRRTYIDFSNVYNTIYGLQINAANLYLYFSSSSGTKSIRAYSLSNAINSTNSTTMTWKTKLAYYESTMTDPGVVSSNGAFLVINVEGILQNWANQSINRAYGFLLKDDIEYSTSVWSTFYSSDYSDTTKIPYLYVATAQRPPVNNVTTKLYYDQTFADIFNDATDAALFLESAELPFNTKWNILFYPSPAYQISWLPGQDCSTPHSLCTMTVTGCGNTCVNNTTTPNHHKNAYRNFNLIKQYSLAGNDILMTLLCQDMCAVDTSHGGIWGLAERPGRYVMVPFDNHNISGSIHTMMHEMSHLYGCHDGDHPDKFGDDCTSGQRCVMQAEFNHLKYYDIPDIWCDHCESEFNRTAN